jgi:hypothetical protein
MSQKNLINQPFYVTITNGPLVMALQIHLYLEQPMEIQLFATFFQRRK